MPTVLPTYTQERDLGREASWGAASPESIGAGGETGRAVAGLGQQLEQTGVERLQQIKALQAADYLENGYGNLVSQAIDNAEALKAKYPNGQGYKEALLGGFDQGLQDLVKGAPSPRAAQQIQTRALRFRQTLDNRATNFTDLAARDAAILNQQQAANGLVNSVRHAPDTIHAVRDTLTDMVNSNPALHPEDKKNLLTHLLPLAGSEAAMGAAEDDPAAFLADADGGKWDGLLSPEGLNQAYGFAKSRVHEQQVFEKQQKAAADQLRKQQEMLDRGEFRAQLYGRIAGDPAAGTPGLMDVVEQGGKLDPKDVPTRDDFVKGYGALAGPKMYATFQNKLAGAQERAKLYDKSEGELEAAVAGGADAAGADASTPYEQTVGKKLAAAQAAHVLALRQKDPVAFAMSRDPGVAKAWQASQADPGDLGRLSAAIGASVSWQAEKGMAPKDYAPLPEARMRAVASALADEASTPQQQIGTLKGMLAAIDGAHYPDDSVKDALKANFFGYLKKAGVPGVEDVEPLVRQDAPDVAVAKVLGAARAKAKLSPDQKRDLQPEIDDHLQDWQHAGALLSSWTGDASHAAAVQGLRGKAENYAGLFGKDKVGEGVGLYTAGMQPVARQDLAAGGVPQGVDVPAVLRGLSAARDDLSPYLPKDHVLAIADPQGRGGRLLQWKADRALAGGADVRFQLAPDGAHLLIPTAGGYAAAYGSDKAPIVIPYDKAVAARAAAGKGSAPLATDDIGRPVPGTGPSLPAGAVPPPYGPGQIRRDATVPNPVRDLFLHPNRPDESGMGGSR